MISKQAFAYAQMVRVLWLGSRFEFTVESGDRVVSLRLPSGTHYRSRLLQKSGDHVHPVRLLEAIEAVCFSVTESIGKTRIAELIRRFGDVSSNGIEGQAGRVFARLQTAIQNLTIVNIEGDRLTDDNSSVWCVRAWSGPSSVHSTFDHHDFPELRCLYLLNMAVDHHDWEKDPEWGIHDF